MDELFLVKWLSVTQLSTPQGQYAFLQCLDNCRPDAVLPSAPYLETALPHLDPKTQSLTADDKIPTCRFCGGTMSTRVRAGDWINERPFSSGRRGGISSSRPFSRTRDGA
ncbi:hypothetical protein ASPFODRAFT_709001 [Aspergillus luchuensis CBS 106.47]|uniref:Uncharacterized protein n=1 Tax=Aspergillus luchuensis (strain CBS 106.47) TaxID=1137211 RepID=A0A1M3SZY8_ASPLC|nr:hypothetical protein ASPFODRAFT_709001 [Aspergillus luchuensis CBS 106.47]